MRASVGVLGRVLRGWGGGQGVGSAHFLTPGIAALLAGVLGVWAFPCGPRGMSACLKCGKCPVFSPQYYLKHKCTHCYCGVVHHRGIPSTVGAGSPSGARGAVPSLTRGRSSLTPSMSEEDVGPAGDKPSEDKKLMAGVAAAPFVWTRHTRRSRSQVRWGGVVAQ